MPKKPDKLCEAQVATGDLRCGHGGYCNDPKTWGECKYGHRGETEAAPATEVAPGEEVRIRMGRLESGEWYCQIGDDESELLIAQTSEFPAEVLRGLSRQLKTRTADLVHHRRAGAGPDDLGTCPHASQDGSMCCLLDRPVSDAQAALASLRSTAAEVTGGHFGPTISASPDYGEIVRLFGRIEKVQMVVDGGDDKMTVTLKVEDTDAHPEYLKLKPYAGQEASAVIYEPRAIVRPEKPLPGHGKDGQRSMFADTTTGGGDGEVTCTHTCEETKAPEGEAPVTDAPVPDPEAPVEETQTEAPAGAPPAEDAPGGEAEQDAA